MVRVILFYLLLGVSSLYALRRGGPSERITAVVLASDVLVTILVQYVGSGAYKRFQAGVFATDLTAFLLLLVVALLTKRWWPLWMAGLGGATVISHIVRLSPMVNSFAYYALIVFWMYPMLLLLIVATWRKGRRHALPREAYP